MSTNSIGTTSKTPTGVDSLFQQIVKQADTNKDGQISVNEFGGVLTKLVQGLSGKQRHAERLLAHHGLGSGSVDFIDADHADGGLAVTRHPAVELDR